MFATITCLILAAYFTPLYAVPGTHLISGGTYLAKHLKSYAQENNLRSATPYYIQQPLDHFDNRETRTWRMRYFTDLRFWRSNGPIYLYINGEFPATGIFQGLSMYELAASTGGAMFMTEHRYYGESIPLDPSRVENLKYLSSKQALADVAYLIQTIKSRPEFRQSKVAVIGGSYAGNLAAWMRLKYPDIVDAAWASSAPVLAKTNFYEYLEMVGQVYSKYGSQECYNKIYQIFNYYHGLSFYNIAHIAQNGSPQEIKSKCYGILSGRKTMNVSYILLQNNYMSQSDIRSWLYQQCTEFSYFTTTDSYYQPFGKSFPLTTFISMCSSQFGINQHTIEQAVANTNSQYGGLTPQLLKVVFLHGSMDPWSRLGLTKSLSDDVPVIIIPDHSHCKDLLSQTGLETQHLINAKHFAMKMLKKWLEISG